MAEIGKKWLGMTGTAGYGWKWLEIARHGLKWDGLITVEDLESMGYEHFGLGEFQLAPAQAGLLV